VWDARGAAHSSIKSPLQDRQRWAPGPIFLFDRQGGGDYIGRRLTQPESNVRHRITRRLLYANLEDSFIDGFGEGLERLGSEFPDGFDQDRILLFINVHQIEVRMNTI
jgi:hypothetical protein